MDVRGEKRYQEICKETFYKAPQPENSKTNHYSDDENEEHAFMSTHENSLKDISRKPPEIVQIEDEYNALTQNAIVLRRGRCGRYFTKYI